MREKPFGIVWRGWDNNSQTGNVTEDRVIASRVMGGSRVSDADTSAQQQGHLQAAATHVLHLCDLVDDFAERVVDEVDEHEVYDGSGTRHRRTAAHAHESALRNRRVAEALRSVFVEQTGSGSEVSTPFTDSLAKDEDARVGSHLAVERLERRGNI